MRMTIDGKDVLQRVDVATMPSMAIRFAGVDERGVGRCSYCGITTIGSRAGLTIHEESHTVPEETEP